MGVSHPTHTTATIPRHDHQIDADNSLGVLLSLFLPPRLRLRLGEQGIKAQLNTGGGAFPIHTDSEEGLDARRVTAVFYLNKGWRPADGGALRLYPFPSAPPLDVEPLDGRLVLFSSTRLHHRVLPSAKGTRRYCFTSWLSAAPAVRGAGGAQQQQQQQLLQRPRPPPAGAPAGEVRRFLLSPATSGARASRTATRRAPRSRRRCGSTTRASRPRGARSRRSRRRSRV